MVRKTICYIFIIPILYLLFLFFINFHFPFSHFFHDLHSKDAMFKQVEVSNAIRLKQSDDYFLSLDPASSLAFYKTRIKEKNLKFVVGLISIKRGGDGKSQQRYGYLPQSAASLDFMFKESHVFNHSICFICNVHETASQHTDAVKLYSYMPYAERYGENSLGVSDVYLPNSEKLFKDVKQHKSIYQKETYDYVFCLKAAAQLNPDFILLLEEDTVPHVDFPQFLEHLMNFRLRDIDVNKFGSVKLYYPSKWSGFGLDPMTLIDLISFSLLVASLILVTIFFLSRQFTMKWWKSIFFVGFLISLPSSWVIGRQNLNELRRLSFHLYRMEVADACCTQAMLYPVQVVNDLSSYMISESRSAHTDLLIGDFISEHKLMAYQFEPNLFHHIGLFSSLLLEQKSPEEFIIP